MAALDVIVDNFVRFWGNPAVRQHFPRLFLVISAVGSLLKELDLVPQTYFSSSRNVLNLYFVKVSWGWTLLLLTPFILLSNSNRRVDLLGRRLLSLVVATAIWYVCTETFFYIEDATGSCFETDTKDVVKEGFSSKASCRQAGFHWHGVDISGHSFILTYSALFIKEEMAPMASLKKPSLSALPRMVLKLLYVALNVIVIIWVWMFTCTSVYFHSPTDKLVGTVCGLLGWYLTYKVLYPKQFSPVLHPQHHLREHKQHN